MRWVHLQGVLVPEAEARVSVLDRGFLLGDGLFETLRAYEGRPAFLREHLARLHQGSAALRIPVPDDVEARVLATLEANGHPDAAVRITLTRGPGGRGASPRGAGPPTVLVTTSSLPYPESFYASGMRAIVSASARPHAAMKSTSYIASILARLEADDAGADEALLSDGAGHLLEATQANLFLVRKGMLLTPPHEGILVGVTRGHILALAREAGLPVLEAPITRADLLGADEAMLTASVLEVAPLVQVDGQAIGGGVPGPLSHRLRAMYRSHAKPRS